MKRIPVKTLYLLLIISIGLVVLGVGSTYALFTAQAEISNPIVLNSNLSYESNIMETIGINVPSGEVVTSTININNTSDSNLNYAVWYLDEGYDVEVGIDSGNPTGSIASGDSTSIDVYIENNGTSDINVMVGVSSSLDAIVLGSGMKIFSDSLNREAYAIYSEDDNSLMFYKNTDIVTVGSTYNGKNVTAIYTGFETDNSGGQPGWSEYRESIKKVIVVDEISPVNTSYWFDQFKTCSSFEVTKLNTTKVTSMTSMFNGAGYDSSEFNVIGLDKWDVSNVMYMVRMFSRSGYNSNSWSIGDISGWNTSSLKDLSFMFYYTALATDEFSIDLGDWDTSEVISFDALFCNTATSASIWTVGNLSRWDTSKVTNMNSMFFAAGLMASTFSLDLSGWNTSNVTTSFNMFALANINKIYVSNLWDMSANNNSTSMFNGCVNIVGGAGTAYNANIIDKTYARIDGGTSNPGYLTYKNPEYILTIDPNGGISELDANKPSIFSNPKLIYNTDNYADISWFNLARDGYKLTGYYDAPSGGINVYDANGYRIVGTKYWLNGAYTYYGNLTVYAQWEKV